MAKRFVVKSETKWWIEETTGPSYSETSTKLPFTPYNEQEAIKLANSLQDAFDAGVASQTNVLLPRTV